MSQKKYFNNVNDLDTGIKRELAEGVSTRIFCGEQAMLSLVDIKPNATTNTSVALVNNTISDFFIISFKLVI